MVCAVDQCAHVCTSVGVSSVVCSSGGPLGQHVLSEPLQAYLLLCRREAEVGSPAFLSRALGKLPPRNVELWAKEVRAFLLERLRLRQWLGTRATHPH